ncbi:Putrescine oxidase [Enhygromyxa salina]|uniref:Putrescine oxidase n=1 Tax=Enhygromyxa salina TaxID=215803 RepID=A0A2S9XDZ4_9BACT|nr:FAD-dependent oxidoreductase [Enhygromyxa salina]PRP91086.1 Putrescine oxidase [Enhygromyxa salina]
MTQPKMKVAVVGAGLAGLTAAYKLVKEGRFEVTVLEARDRIGGRVLSRKIEGCDVDLGGFLVFPWYHDYRTLCAELDVDSELHRVPSVDIYYDLGDRHPLREDQFKLHLIKLIAVATKSIASALTAGPLDRPNLDHYQQRTIEACVDDWVGDPVESAKYKRLIDTLCQGYCYPPIAEYKAAFAMPIYPRTVFGGSSTKSDMFRHGSRSLPDALLSEFLALGGQLRLGCEVKGFDGDGLETSEGWLGADRFVFAQNADHPLMRDLIPRSKRSVPYTRFVTAVVRLRERYQPQTPDWGAIFFTPREEPGAQALSMIDLERLYASEALRHHYTLNIRLDHDEAIDLRGIEAAVNALCPEGGGVEEVVTHEVWAQSMPVSDELFVEAVRALQGVGGCYFAGDYLGCPSMEVAVATGLDAARAIAGSHPGFIAGGLIR